MDHQPLPRSSIETKAYLDQQKARNLIDEAKCIEEVDGRMDLLEISMLQFINDSSNDIIMKVSLGLQFGPDAQLASDFLNGMMAQAQFLHAHYLMQWSLKLNSEFRKYSKFTRMSTSTLSAMQLSKDYQNWIECVIYTKLRA